MRAEKRASAYGGFIILLYHGIVSLTVGLVAEYPTIRSRQSSTRAEVYLERRPGKSSNVELGLYLRWYRMLSSQQYGLHVPNEI